MFENLTNQLTQIFKNISGQSTFSEENIQQALREVRLSLIEADVAIPVVKQFVEHVKAKTIGQTIDSHLKASQALVKIIHEELITTLGGENAEINLKTQPPAIILMAGLQGAGKTTATAKLAKYLKDIHNKSVMMVSTDIYRPAAIEQLEQLARQIDTPFFKSSQAQDPIKIAQEAVQEAKKNFVDILLIDTAGRLHIDEAMMQEISHIHQAVNPVETLFVVDSMTGQDAANTARAFHETLPLTGVILTKIDGDARGGAALSVKSITGQPIKFLSSGEKIVALEPFHPDRIASRILGMGDMLSLIEEVERKVDKESTEKLAKKIKKGKGFDLEDFKQQLLQMNNMGGITSMMGKLPMLGQLSQQPQLSQMHEKTVARTIAIINSMTVHERRIPKIIQGSRKRRIAKGSGCQIQDVNKLLKQYEQMQKMMQKFTKPGGIKQMMRGLSGIPGLKDMFKM